jgi:hypothetical protein
MVEVKPLSISAQGRSLQGMSLQGASLQGRSLQGATLQAVSLHGYRLDGSVVKGARQGSVLSGKLSDGSSVDLVIAAVETDEQDASGEITLYTVLYRNPATAELENICPADLQGQQKAIAVPGVWDATGARKESGSSFTFGCTSGVIAKCVRWGYKPWKSAGGKSLVDHHQACTRMARADYCGDGVSHTLDGTWVDIYDGLAIQTKTPNSGMAFEAAWSTKGAVCVSKPRYFGLPRVMDTSAIPRTSCQRAVAQLSLGPVPAETSWGGGDDENGSDDEHGGDGTKGICKLHPMGGQVLIAESSYVNVITE